MLEIIYEKIGAAGIVIAILSFVSLYLFLSATIYLAWIPHSHRRFCAMFQSSESTKLVQQAKKNPLSFVWLTTLKNKPLRSELQGETQYLFQRSFGSIYISLTILRLISVISPLLGLLGTVLGITRVFHKMSMQTAVDNAMLAGGIWEALITTIMGMCVAIPTLVFYYLLRLRVRFLLIESIEQARKSIL